jgi:hypothetical protein
MIPSLDEILETWKQDWYAKRAQEIAEMRRYSAPGKMVVDAEAGGRKMIEEQANATRPYLRFLLEDNWAKTAEELEEIAAHLSPGGAHTGGWLIQLVYAKTMPDPLLMAAVLRYNWGGGKMGFQFMPDPRHCDIDDYADEALDLMERLASGTEGDPLRISTGDDRAFYERLPPRFTIYRGCNGISAGLAGLGVCWTTSRPIAEWFACRHGAENPVLMTARVSKSEVRLAFASEMEIVATPSTSRTLICRPRTLPHDGRFPGGNPVAISGTTHRKPRKAGLAQR